MSYKTDLLEKRKILGVILVFCLLFSLFSLEIRKDYTDKEYAQNQDGSLFIKNKLDLYKVFENDENVLINLSFSSYVEPQNTIFFWNGMKIRNSLIEKAESFLILSVSAKKGLNKLEIIPSKKCQLILEKEEKKDPRCVSLILHKIAFLDKDNFENESIIFSQGFYAGEEKWFGNKSEILLLNVVPKKVKIKIDLESPFKEILEIKLDEKKLGMFNTSKGYVLLPTLEPRDEITKLKLISVDGCKYPKNDSRCMSFKIKNVSLIPIEKTEYFNYFINFNNWFKKESSDIYHRICDYTCSNKKFESRLKMEANKARDGPFRKR